MERQVGLGTVPPPLRRSSNDDLSPFQRDKSLRVTGPKIKTGDDTAGTLPRERISDGPTAEHG